MQACVDVAFTYAHLRESFGKKSGEHQVSSSYYSYLRAPLATGSFFLFFSVSVCGILPFSPQFD